MRDIYKSEFNLDLMQQSTSRTDKFKNCSHKGISIGDLVIVKEDNTKRNHFPLCKVVKIEQNSLGEVVACKLLKGASREIISRHSSRIIPILNSSF